MQNKGFIRLFTVLLILAALYSLSFSFFTWKANHDADKYAQGNEQMRREYLDSLSRLDSYYNFLGLRKFSYAETQQRSLNLGLDLKGGMNVTLRISIEDMILNLSNDGKKDTLLMKVLARTDELERDSREDYVSLFGKAFQEIAPQGTAMRTMFIANEAMSSRINYQSTNEEVLKVLAEQAKASLDNSFDVIRTRIDRFGVVQPNIQNLGNGRVLVELPGVVDQDRVRDLLQSSAKLEFWETWNASEVLNVVFEVNNTLADLNEVSDKAKDASTSTATEQAKADTTKQETASGELSLKEQLQDSAAAATQADAQKTKEEIARENPLLNILIPNVSQEGYPGYGPIVGFAQRADIPYIDSLLAVSEVQLLLQEIAPEVKFAWGKKANSNGFFELIALKSIGGEGNPALDGSVVVDARPEFTQTGGAASVQMIMNADGAREWRRLTRDNTGRSIAIVLDGFVYSYPNVQGEIPNGISSITGDFSIAEATDLANILKSGKLSAATKIEFSEFVGPTLGAESIQKGLMSVVVALIFMFGYLFFYYRKAGTVANIALLLNLFLVFGVLASLGAVLTLSGIAGIVLSLAMAIDANVIIYERVREELSQGKGMKLAIADGFKGSYSAIIDGNVTTLIIGIVLYMFGKGSIQGFATTLIIGILTTLFCGIFITRMIFERFLAKKRTISFDRKATRNAFKNIHIDFMGNRKKYYIVSSIIIGVCILAIVVRGFQIGVDFKGGRSYTVVVEGERNVEEIEESLAKQFGKAPEVKTLGAEGIKVTTDYKINDKGTEVDTETETLLFKGLQEVPDLLPKGITQDDFMKNNLTQSNMVGPTIANDMIWSAIISIVVALIFMFIYILIRFRNWEFGLSAALALLHDVFVVIGVFALLHGLLPFSMEVGQEFIAALLTIIGYSLNDTVVIFDRIREMRTEYPKRNTLKLFNQGVNSTLSRTITTSATTLLVLLIIFFFGGDSMKGFIFAMIIGVVIGSYSTIFIASPLAYEMLKKGKKTIETE
ncbi:MAG: protein translocase subunit SecDF [Bacteroidales bacterium]|jgi:SecD/SecF fusion protein|nr:protein translocase subunit SecDF [Bacteroidales bacterium]